MASSCICNPDYSNGYSYNQFVGSYFGECVYDPVTWAPFICGMLSILVWIFALLPQIITNHRTKTTAALSPTFLIVWLSGDISSLIGSITVQQRMTMTLCALYFCVNDVILLSQKAYYRRSSQKRGNRTPALVFAGIILFGGGALQMSSLSLSKSATSRSLLQSVSLDLCDATSDDPIRFLTGSISSWIAGSLYFFSRVPQIRFMIVNKRVEGLDVRTFILCIAANVFGGLQFILEAAMAEEVNWGRWFARTLPFVIGSIGTLVFDFTIITLYTTFNKQITRNEKPQQKD